MNVPIEYATTSDGVRIATFAVGKGPAMVIAATPPWSHITAETAIPQMASWQQALSEHVRVIRYDCRGTGLSDRSAVDFSLDAQLRDLEAVVAHHGLRRFAMWGSIGGSPVSIVYASRCPERVSHLLLWAAFARGDTYYTEEYRGMGALLRDNWGRYTDAYAQAAFGWVDSDVAERYSQLMRDGISQEAAMQAMDVLFAVDVTSEARSIGVPTLSIGRRDLPQHGIEYALELAGLIPGARMLVLDGDSPAPFLGDIGPMIDGIRGFIATRSPEKPRDPPVQLTTRESQVLRLLARGLTGKEIAAELRVSLPTAQRHIANIYAKLGARGRVAAVTYAIEHGLAGSLER